MGMKYFIKCIKKFAFFYIFLIYNFFIWILTSEMFLEEKQIALK